MMKRYFGRCVMSGALVLGVVLGFAGGPAAAAEIVKSMDLAKALNMKRDSQASVGRLRDLILGGKKLANDLPVKVPENQRKSLKVAAVLTEARWDGGFAHPVCFVGHISTKNKQLVQVMMHRCAFR